MNSGYDPAGTKSMAMSVSCRYPGPQCRDNIYLKPIPQQQTAKPALPIYQVHWGNWLELTLLTFLAVTSKVSFQTKPENPQLINKLFGG